MKQQQNSDPSVPKLWDMLNNQFTIISQLLTSLLSPSLPLSPSPFTRHSSRSSIRITCCMIIRDIVADIVADNATDKVTEIFPGTVRSDEADP